MPICLIISSSNQSLVDGIHCDRMSRHEITLPLQDHYRMDGTMPTRHGAAPKQRPARESESIAGTSRPHTRLLTASGISTSKAPISYARSPEQRKKSSSILEFLCNIAENSTSNFYSQTAIILRFLLSNSAPIRFMIEYCHVCPR